MNARDHEEHSQNIGRALHISGGVHGHQSKVRKHPKSKRGMVGRAQRNILSSRKIKMKYASGYLKYYMHVWRVLHRLGSLFQWLIGYGIIKFHIWYKSYEGWLMPVMQPVYNWRVNINLRFDKSSIAVCLSSEWHNDADSSTNAYFKKFLPF